MRWMATAFGAALAMWLPETQAGFLTGDDLHELCTSQDANDVMLCHAYIEGVWDRERLVVPECVVTPLNINDLRGMVATEIRHNPGLATKSAAGFVLAVFKKRYPCKGS